MSIEDRRDLSRFVRRLDHELDQVQSLVGYRQGADATSTLIVGQVEPGCDMAVDDVAKDDFNLSHARSPSCR